MPNDAKFGLVVGVATVLLIAAIFFRREATSPEPAPVAAMPTQSTVNAVVPVVFPPLTPGPSD